VQWIFSISYFYKDQCRIVRDNQIDFTRAAAVVARNAVKAFGFEKSQRATFCCLTALDIIGHQ
jgi:hypothetical protein